MSRQQRSQSRQETLAPPVTPQSEEANGGEGKVLPCADPPPPPPRGGGAAPLPQGGGAAPSFPTVAAAEVKESSASAMEMSPIGEREPPRTCFLCVVSAMKAGCGVCLQEQCNFFFSFVRARAVFSVLK